MMMKRKKLYAFASSQSVRDIDTKAWHYHTRGCCCCYYHTPSLTIKVLFVTQWGVLDHHIVMIIRHRNSNSWVHLKYRSRSWSWEWMNQIKHTHQGLMCLMESPPFTDMGASVAHPFFLLQFMGYQWNKPLRKKVPNFLSVSQIWFNTSSVSRSTTSFSLCLCISGDQFFDQCGSWSWAPIGENQISSPNTRWSNW
jgi:hypothetical protein